MPCCWSRYAGLLKLSVTRIIINSGFILNSTLILKNIKYETLMSIIKELLRIIFPPKCIFCGETMQIDADLAICRGCAFKAPFFMHDYLMGDSGETHAKYNDRETPAKRCDRVICALRYTGVAKRAIRRFKFSNKPEYGRTLGAILAEKVARVEGVGSFGVVTAVPISENRERARGYNQAAILAGYVAMHLGVGFEAGLLSMDKGSQRQSGLSNVERIRNAMSKFMPNEDKISLVTGKSVLLIDDISTTLSTINACAAILKECGALSVVGAVAASGLTEKAIW